MSDRGLVDAAIMEHLASDAALMALCPDGVYWGMPQPGSYAFVVVALFDGTERPGLAGVTLWERSVYLVKAVILSQGGSEPREAAARIHALLQNAELDLSAAGYQAMLCKRLEPIHLPPEIDPDEKSARWQHVGGQYEVWSYPA